MIPLLNINVRGKSVALLTCPPRPSPCKELKQDAIIDVSFQIITRSISKLSNFCMPYIATGYSYICDTEAEIMFKSDMCDFHTLQ